MKRKIAVLGLWHQGLVGAACLADWGHDVVAADADSEKINKLKNGVVPIFEPGLDDLLTKGVNAGNLRFTGNMIEAVAGCEFVMLMHDVPVDQHDISDLSVIYETVRNITPSLAENVVILVTAQIPVGTCENILKNVKEIRPDLSVSIAYSPENLRLGVAIERYRRPPLPLIGVENGAVFTALTSLFGRSGVEWRRCDVRTAEMAKHALNGFLAMTITFGNELGNLCDELGVDGHRLADLLKLEPRISSQAMLYPGLGFSGGTLARDVQTLRAFGKSYGLEIPLLDGLWLSNHSQKQIVIRKLKKYFDGDLSGRKICVLGLTYKPNTSTLRRSAALELISDLETEGVEITASDPRVDENELTGYERFLFYRDPHDAIKNVDAIVIMTPWREYLSLDFRTLKELMGGDLLFDTANMLDAKRVTEVGLFHLAIGDGKVLDR